MSNEMESMSSNLLSHIFVFLPTIGSIRALRLVNHHWCQTVDQDVSQLLVDELVQMHRKENIHQIQQHRHNNSVAMHAQSMNDQEQEHRARRMGMNPTHSSPFPDTRERTMLDDTNNTPGDQYFSPLPSPTATEKGLFSGAFYVYKNMTKVVLPYFQNSVQARKQNLLDVVSPEQLQCQFFTKTNTHCLAWRGDVLCEAPPITRLYHALTSMDAPVVLFCMIPKKDFPEVGVEQCLLDAVDDANLWTHGDYCPVGKTEWVEMHEEVGTRLMKACDVPTGDVTAKEMEVTLESKSSLSSQTNQEKQESTPEKQEGTMKKEENVPETVTDPYERYKASALKKTAETRQAGFLSEKMVFSCLFRGHGYHYKDAQHENRFLFTSEDIRGPTIVNSGNQQLLCIRQRFASGSTLHQIQLEQFPYLMQIDDSFAQECPFLQSVELCNLPLLQSIGANFCARCPKLTSVKLSNLLRLESIGASFCKGASFSTNADVQLDSLPRLTEIGSRFLQGCVDLQSFILDGSQLPKLEKISSAFFYECENIQTLSILNCDQLWEIDSNNFCVRCKLLQHVEIGWCPRLRRTGDYFLAQMEELKSVSFQGCTELEFFGPSFAWQCSKLESLNLKEIRCPPVGKWMCLGVPEDQVEVITNKEMLEQCSNVYLRGKNVGGDKGLVRELKWVKQLVAS